ncbi:unnamed protein product [Heterobilharzia americana]|nr:unnamed protein product [Heterobilharzia americana]
MKLTTVKSSHEEETSYISTEQHYSTITLYDNTKIYTNTILEATTENKLTLTTTQHSSQPFNYTHTSDVYQQFSLPPYLFIVIPGAIAASFLTISCAIWLFVCKHRKVGVTLKYGIIYNEEYL